MRSSAKDKGPIRRLLEHWFCEEQWDVGLIAPDAFWRGADRGELLQGEVTWLKIPANCFLADPCWLSEANGLFLAERLQFRRRVGRIVLCKVKGNAVRVLRELNLPSGHHSYPMVYHMDGKSFLIPECAEHERVSRFEITAEGRGEAEHVLVEGCQIVDPTLFEAAGKFWLFGNPLEDWDGKLIVLSAPRIDGPWTEAPFSPMEIANCRGAGRIIQRNSDTYWITQYNERRYGGGLIIRKINRIDDGGLDQQIVTTLLPRRNGRYPMGTHTVAEGAEHYLIDGLRVIFRPTRPLDVLISRIRRRGRPG